MSGPSLYPGYTGNATSQRQHITLLPAVNQTTALARFFGSTVDPVFQVGGFQPITAYIGQYPSYYKPEQDFYLPEPTEARRNYQLEPAMISLDPSGTLSHALTYPDLLGYLRGQGAVMGQDSRMFEAEYYVWAPPVDLDKLTNYHQYYWFGDYTGGEALPVLTLTSPTCRYTGDGRTSQFALPLPVATISPAQETIAAYVNSVRVSHAVITANTISLPLPPLPDDQIVVTRHDDLAVALTGAPVDAPPGALYGPPPGDTVSQFTLNRFVDAATLASRGIDPALDQTFLLSSGMRLNLQDTLRVFSGFSSQASPAGVNTGAHDQAWETQAWENQDWDADYLSPPLPLHDQAVFDGAQYDYFLVDGVGQSIRLTPDRWLNRQLDPQFITIDRSSRDHNPWSLTNNWHHKDSFGWSGLTFPDRQAQRPIVEFIRDILLHNYGTRPIGEVDGVLSSATAQMTTTEAGSSPIAFDAIAGQPLGSVSVDAGVVLFSGMRLLVAQQGVRTQQIYQVGQSDGCITLTAEPAEAGDIVRILHASGYGPAQCEMWFDGTIWQAAQGWQENAGEATDPRFRLFDLNAHALDDPDYYPNSDFAGNRIFGYASGSGGVDRLLLRPLQYDNNGALLFENDVATRRAATVLNGVATPISGLYCYQTSSGGGMPMALWHRVTHPTAQDIFTRDRDGTPYYTVPMNLVANPGSADVSLISRSDWVMHFRNAIAMQNGFAGNPFSANNWRDSARDLNLGTEVVQHVAPLLKLMLLATDPRFDYFAAVRFVEAEYNLFRNKFVRKMVELEHQAKLAVTVNPDGSIQAMNPAQIEANLNLILTNLKVDRNASFPFALSTMAATSPSSQYFIPSTPAFLGLLAACKPGLISDDTYKHPVAMVRGHDGSLTPAYGDWRDGLLVALEQRIYDSIPDSLTAIERPVFDLGYYCAGRFCPAASGAFATTDPSYIAVSYRRGEIQAMLAPLFERWAQNARLDYRTNTSFDPDDPFTWNYRAVQDRFGSALPGHWKAIYRWYFDTERPHQAPWEMLGFTDAPSWWTQYYGAAPYTSANTALWHDLEAGLIRAGPRAGINRRYARPGLSEIIPVDAAGALRDPLACAIVAIAPSDTLAARPWANGDGGPAENIWITSPAYRYALAQIAFLAKPARLVEMGWDTVHCGLSAFADQWIDRRTQQRPANAATLVHGEIGADGLTPTLIHGIQQWLVDYLSASSMPSSLLGHAVRGLNVRLLHRMAGFITSDDLHVVADNFGVLPNEDVKVMLYTAPNTGTEVYSGVLIEYVGTGWRVVGYDARTPAFRIIPPDPGGASDIVSLATSAEPVIVEWHPNSYFRQGAIATYQGYTYVAIGSHLSGPKFEQRFWTNDPTPYPLAPRVTHYLHGLADSVAMVPYGSEFQTIQEVADFLWSYERWLISRGWRFMATDAVGGAQTWTRAVREFLTWTQVQWAVGNFIALSPGAATLHFEAASGMVLDVESNDTGYFGLLDRSGSPILKQNVHLSRFGADLVLNAKNADIFAARVRCVSVEHALVFNNTTIFNDVVYEPLFNMRQARLKLLVNRTTDWTGRLEAPGFIVSGASLVPSFERNVEDVRLMFDIEQSLRRDITAFARHNINYQARDYLENLLLSDLEQFEFYQGMIAQKGSGGVFQKLLRSARVSANSTILFLEEYALRRPARFGGPAQPRISFRLEQSTVVRDPQFIRLGDHPQIDPTWIILPPGDPRWLDPPTPQGGPPGLSPSMAFFALQDPAKPIPNRLLDAGPVRLDEVDHGVLHVADLTPLYAALVANGLDPFPVQQRIWLYDAPDSRSWDVRMVFDLGSQPNPLSRTLTVTEDPTVHGIRLVFSQPHGLSAAAQGQFIIIAGLAYCVPEIAGLARIETVNGAGNWIEIDVAGTAGYDFISNRDAARVPPVVRRLQSMRHATYAAMQAASSASPVAWPVGALAWVDADADGGGDAGPNGSPERGWAVYQRSGSGFVRGRQQPPRLDPSQIALSAVYDSATRINDHRQIIVDEPIFDDLVIVDPLAGFLPGVATREITIQSEFDPAKYTTSRRYGSVVDAWGSEQVGQVWWDVSTVRYLNPYTDRAEGVSSARVLAEINYRMTYWARIAPGTSVDIYEWIASDLPPDQYAARQRTDPTGAYQGTVYRLDDASYTTRSVYSPAFGRDITTYHFWVSGLTTVPNVARRHISTSAVATILQNPTAQDIPWFAPILPDGMLVSGLMAHLNDTSTVLQVRCINRADDPGHHEWFLLRPNDKRSQPPDWLWRSLGNALSGFDEAMRPVPDPALHPARAVGIQQGQSLFAQDRDQPGDRLGLLDARESFIGIINAILATIPVIEDRPGGVVVLSRATPIGVNLIWTRPNDSFVIEPPPDQEWDAGYRVHSIAARNRLLLRPEFLGARADDPIRRVLVDGTALSHPQWSIWWFQPAVAVRLLEQNRTAQYPLAPVDYLFSVADSVFTLAPSYERAVPTWAARNGLVDLSPGTRVCVSADETADGFWVVYRYAPSEATADGHGFVVHRVQSYRTGDFYQIVDWYEQTFDTGAQTIRFSAANPPQVSYASVAERTRVEGTMAPANVFVQILDPASGHWQWQYFRSGTGWLTVAQQAGTIALKANFFNAALDVHGVGPARIDTLFNRDGSWEIKVLADGLRRGGLLLDAEINQVLFSMIHFIHAQQDVVDWVFKTSFMVIAGYAIPLQQTGVQQKDVTDSLIAYVKEVKPYHVKVRDYTTQYVPDIDLTPLRACDFDKTAYSDKATVPQRLDPTDADDFAVIATWYGEPAANLALLNWQQWQRHAALPMIQNSTTGLWSNPLRHVTTTLRFDRVSDYASDAVWDGRIANTANVAWDEIGWDLNETGETTASGRVMDTYAPTSGMPPLSTPADLINTLFRFPAVPIDGNALGNAAYDISVDASSDVNAISVNPDAIANAASDPAYGRFDPLTRTPTSRFVDPAHPQERVAAVSDDGIVMTITAHGTPGAPVQQVRVFDLYGVNEPALRFAAPSQSASGVWVYLDGLRAQDGLDYSLDSFAQSIHLHTLAQRVTIRSFGFGGANGIIARHDVSYDPAQPALNLATVSNAACVQVLVDGVMQASTAYQVANASLAFTGATPSAGAAVSVILWDNGVDTTCRVQTQRLDLADGTAVAGGFTQYRLSLPDTETQPLHAGTIVELDGRRLTPPLTYYGRIDAQHRGLSVDFDVSVTTPIDLMSNGVWYQNVTVPRWSNTVTNGSTTRYPFNLVAEAAPSSTVPGGFVLYDRTLVATDPAFMCADFGAVFYETQNPLGATMDYRITHTGGSYAVQIADAVLANAGSVVVTTFSHAGLMAIRTQTYFAAMDGAYRLMTPFDEQYSMVSFDRLMLAPAVDYDFTTVREGFGQSAFGGPFDSQYNATVMTIPRDPAQSSNQHGMQPVVATVFNGAPARMPTIWRQASTTPASVRMAPAPTTAGFDDDRFSDPFTLYDAFQSPPDPHANAVSNDPNRPLPTRAWQYGYPRYPGVNPNPVQLYDMAGTWEFSHRPGLTSGRLATALQPEDSAIRVTLDGLADVAPALWPLRLATLDNGASYQWSGQVLALPDRAANRPGVVWVGAERIEYLSLDYDPPSFSALPVPLSPPVIILRDLRRGTRGTVAQVENRISSVAIANGATTDFAIATSAPVPEVLVRMGNASAANWADYGRAVLSTANAVVVMANPADHYRPVFGPDYHLVHGANAVSLRVAPPAGAWVSLGVTLDYAHPPGTLVSDGTAVFQPARQVGLIDRLGGVAG